MHRARRRAARVGRDVAAGGDDAVQRPAVDAQVAQHRDAQEQGVDPYEASTLVKTLETQLETAYTIVSKIQQLSLVNYL